jgi:hypothetical protein
MNGGDWGTICSAAVAVAALVHSIWTRRRTSQAALAAANAEIRAEEALLVAKEVAERDHARFVDEQAELDAPQIADRWIGEIQQKWGERSHSDHFVLSKQVVTPAERRAVEIVRRYKESLYILEIISVAAENVCRISAWNRGGYHRRFGKLGPPPGRGAS